MYSFWHELRICLQANVGIDFDSVNRVVWLRLKRAALWDSVAVPLRSRFEGYSK